MAKLRPVNPQARILGALALAPMTVEQLSRCLTLPAISIRHALRQLGPRVAWESTCKVGFIDYRIYSVRHG